MRVLVTGRNKETLTAILEEFNDIVITDKSPEVVITHGGDGALLGAERDFPSIPKLPVRDSHTAPLCEKHSSFRDLFSKYISDKLTRTELLKLEGKTENNKTLRGINDVFIHNVDRVGAMRYRVWIGGAPYGHEIIGDGVGVSTVHGSTAYYRSITHSIFKIGIGLAFSNSTEVTNHLVLPEETEIDIEITRGPAILVADNTPNGIMLQEKEKVQIRKSSETAIIYGLDIFMCPDCRKLRHPRD